MTGADEETTSYHTHTVSDQIPRSMRPTVDRPGHKSGRVLLAPCRALHGCSAALQRWPPRVRFLQRPRIRRPRRPHRRLPLDARRPDRLPPGAVHPPRRRAEALLANHAHRRRRTRRQGTTRPTHCRRSGRRTSRRGPPCAPRGDLFGQIAVAPEVPVPRPRLPRPPPGHPAPPTIPTWRAPAPARACRPSRRPAHDAASGGAR